MAHITPQKIKNSKKIEKAKNEHRMKDLAAEQAKQLEHLDELVKHADKASKARSRKEKQAEAKKAGLAREREASKAAKRKSTPSPQPSMSRPRQATETPQTPGSSHVPPQEHRLSTGSQECANAIDVVTASQDFWTKLHEARKRKEVASIHREQTPELQTKQSQEKLQPCFSEPEHAQVDQDTAVTESRAEADATEQMLGDDIMAGDDATDETLDAEVLHEAPSQIPTEENQHWCAQCVMGLPHELDPSLRYLDDGVDRAWKTWRYHKDKSAENEAAALSETSLTRDTTESEPLYAGQVETSAVPPSADYAHSGLIGGDGCVEPVRDGFDAASPRVSTPPMEQDGALQVEHSSRDGELKVESDEASTLSAGSLQPKCEEEQDASTLQLSLKSEEISTETQNRSLRANTPVGALQVLRRGEEEARAHHLAAAKAYSDAAEAFAKAAKHHSELAGLADERCSFLSTLMSGGSVSPSKLPKEEQHAIEQVETEMRKLLDLNNY